jgi:hypothetical protein
MLHKSYLTRIIAGSVAIAMIAALVSANVSAAPLAVTSLGIGVGQAGSYSVLGKAGVTNVGNSTISGNVGADDIGSITGMGSATIGGSILSAPAVNGSEADAQAAYLVLTSKGPGTPIGVDPTGPLHPGVYSVGALNLTGELTLDGKGTYIFLIASGLTSSGSINLTNGANACNVFWQVTSSATLIGGSFAGTIIADASITFGNGVALNGRALALTGNVTLINNSITGPKCGGVGGPKPIITPAPVTPVSGTPVLGNGPAHVNVTYKCMTDGRVEVQVGLSAGVTVSGLGADIYSAVATGNDKIFVYLSPGHYEWTATPPAGKYLLDVDHGVIDVPSCGDTIAVVKPVVALPNTGGAPLQSENSSGTIVLAILVLGAMGLALSIQARRRHTTVD